MYRFSPLLSLDQRSKERILGADPISKSYLIQSIKEKFMQIKILFSRQRHLLGLIQYFFFCVCVGGGELSNQ